MFAIGPATYWVDAYKEMYLCFLRKASNSLALVALAVVVGVAASHAAPGGHSKAKTPPLVLLDARGRPAQTLMDQAGLFPGMATRTSSIIVLNRGTRRARFVVSTTSSSMMNQISILDVLQVTVKDLSTGKMLYQGPLSSIVAQDPLALAPSQSRRLAIYLTWPDEGSIDDRFQGADASFSFALGFRFA